MSSEKITGSVTTLQPEEIGKRIRQLREQRGLNQKELARQVGLKSANALKNYEKGQIPKVPVLVRLAVALGVSIDDLLFGGAALESIVPADPLSRAERRALDKAERLLREGSEETKKTLIQQIDLVDLAHSPEKKGLAGEV